MPATVPDLEDEFDDYQARMHPCPTCWPGACVLPPPAAERHDPPTT